MIVACKFSLKTFSCFSFIISIFFKCLNDLHFIEGGIINFITHTSILHEGGILKPTARSTPITVVLRTIWIRPNKSNSNIVNIYRYCYGGMLALHRWGWVWATGNVRCLFGRQRPAYSEQIAIAGENIGFRFKKSLSLSSLTSGDSRLLMTITQWQGCDGVNAKRWHRNQHNFLQKGVNHYG